MFGKLKDKLKGWFKSSKDKVEETAEAVETTEIKEVKIKEKKPKKEPVKKIKEPKKEEEPKKQKEEKEKPISKKEEKEIQKKADIIIKKAKEEKAQEAPVEFVVAKQKFEPDTDKIKEEIKELEEKSKEEKIEEKPKKEKKQGFFSKIFSKKEKELADIKEEIKEVKEELVKEETEIEKLEKEKERFVKPKEILEGEKVEKIKLEEKEKPEKIKKEKKKPIIEPEPIREAIEEELIEEPEPIIEPEPIREAIEEEPKKEKKSFFKKLKSSLSYKITQEAFEEIFDDLEMLLLENNTALEAVESLKKILEKNLIGREIKKDNLETIIAQELKNALNELIIKPIDPLKLIKEKKKNQKEPFIILFFGINGTGKTTSIAKIANLLKKNNLSVVLAAGDTFRAASIEQIQEHAKKINVPLIKQEYNSDPAAVGFDAIKYAKNKHIDVVLIDTAGRMHTKTNLIAEMEKICRVTNPDLKIFVAESIAGNDATQQAKTFNEAIGIDGSILSKADVDEKGGTIISVSHVTNKPILYLGTGQAYDDIKLFDKEDFIKSLGL